MISGNIINTLHRAVYRHSSWQFSLAPKNHSHNSSVTRLCLPWGQHLVLLHVPYTEPTEGALLPSTTGCCVQQAADVAPDAATGLRKLLPKSLARAQSPDKPNICILKMRNWQRVSSLCLVGAEDLKCFELQWNKISAPQASSQQVRAQTPQLSPCQGWQEHTELSSSSEVFFLFQGGSLGCPELTVQLLCFQSK